LFIESVHDSADEGADFVATKNTDQSIDVRALLEEAFMLAFGEATGDDNASYFA
jgi:hypothetical protein